MLDDHKHLKKKDLNELPHVPNLDWKSQTLPKCQNDALLLFISCAFGLDNSVMSLDKLQGSDHSLLFQTLTGIFAWSLPASAVLFIPYERDCPKEHMQSNKTLYWKTKRSWCPGDVPGLKPTKTSTSHVTSKKFCTNRAIVCVLCVSKTRLDETSFNLEWGSWKFLVF